MRSALVAIGAARQAFFGSDAPSVTMAVATKLIYATQLVADKLPAQIHQLPSHCESLMPRIIVLALLFFVSVPSIAGAAPIRIAYKGRFVDLERRFEPNAPFYCDVHGEFVIDETLPVQQAVVSASMVIDEKGLSLLAPADWRSSFINNNIGEFFIDDSGEIQVIRAYDEISFFARFAGWDGVIQEEHGSIGFEMEAPFREPDTVWFVPDSGYGIMLSLLGPSS